MCHYIDVWCPSIFIYIRVSSLNREVHTWLKTRGNLQILTLFNICNYIYSKSWTQNIFKNYNIVWTWSTNYSQTLEDVIIKQSSTTSFTSYSLLDTNVNS